MRVLLDVDGVLADLVGGLCRAVPGLREEHFPAFDFKHCTGPATAESLYRILRDQHFYRDLAWYPGAKQAVTALAEKHDVAFVTAGFSQGPQVAWDRWSWLNDAFPDIPVILTAHKAWIRGDALVDDNPDYIHTWEAEHPEGRGFLIDRPWSRAKGMQTWGLDEVVRALCGQACGAV